jgi:hypothetical protein
VNTRPSEPLPTIRVKLKCRDEAEFLALLAPVIARRGVFVARPKPPAEGSRVKVELEFAPGVVGVSGEAVVLRHVTSGNRTGVTLHLVRLDPESAQFPLVPLPTVLAPTEFAPQPGKSKPGLRSATVFDVDSLRLIETPPPPPPQALEPMPAPAPAPAPVAAAPAPMLATAPVVNAPAPISVAPPVAATPALRPALTGSAASEASVSANGSAKGRRFFVATGLAAVLVGALTFNSLRSKQELRAAVATHVNLADERIAAGRPARPSGDEALDHLLAARALRVDDPRVTERLSALADKFEQLGDKALDRGDAVEAAVHYQGAVLAEPGRKKASQRLKEIEARVRSGSAGKPTE